MVRNRVVKGVNGQHFEADRKVAFVKQATMPAQRSQKRTIHSPAVLINPCKVRSRRKIVRQPKTNIVTFFLTRRPSALESSISTTCQDHPEDLQKRNVRKLKTYKSKSPVLADFIGTSRKSSLKGTQKRCANEISSKNFKEPRERLCKPSYGNLQGCKTHIAATEKIVCREARNGVPNLSLCHESNPCGDNDTFKAVSGETKEMTAKQRQSRKRKRKRDLVPMDNVSKIKRRVKNALIRMRLEQNLIDAYVGEGWKGHSREKIKPEKELQRAEVQIKKCKLVIREAMQELDSLGLEGSIQDSAFDSEGRVRYDEIFCSKCHSREAFLNNDIILCDGTCNRGFHQKCLHPPLATHEIPPEGEGWLCPVCDCKLDCLLTINKYLGTNFQVETNWRDIFPEVDPCTNAEAQATEEWPSDDSEDDDYDPDKHDPSTMEGNAEDHEVASSDETGSSSDSDPSEEESTPCDSDGESVQARQFGFGEEKEITLMPQSGSFFTLETLDKRPNHVLQQSNEVKLTNHVTLDKDDTDNDSFHIPGKRQRKEVDYKKLNDEIFGKDDLDKEQHTDDEDWGPRKRKRRGKGDVAVMKDGDENTKPVFGTAENFSTGQIRDQESSLPRSGCGGDSADSTIHSGDNRGICEQASEKKMKIRMPDDVVMRLRGVFAENQLPSKSFKEELSRQLGISYKKVHVWFRNLRYQALKKGLAKPSKPRTSSYQQKTEDSSECIFESPKHIGQRGQVLAVNKEELLQEKEKHRENNLLIEKLDAMQLKVEELKKKMEAVYHFCLESDAVKEKFGKHIIYLPFVEVVEKVAVA
ncbi:hypothetical protein O6H91_12G057100 [Diphasiastrum complanatum]|uniref:Uncharacterized protein n=1 Tax=Diphasiastrum complanatum TaxID=34168 RepID=A0ACC2C2H2_DIPCM|nr:hypothetical protein O6H91_12G057100 [Diphasiastrum complanatum]